MLNIYYYYINKCVEKLEKAILPLVVNYQNEINLLLTIPGVQYISAIYILSEIGSNMEVFVDDKHLCSWAGLTPQNNESASKKKSVRIFRAGVYIKPLLVQCANCTIKDKSCEYFKLIPPLLLRIMMLLMYMQKLVLIQ